MVARNPHIHEILVTRGDARGDLERQLLIHDPRNCGFVCAACHPLAEGKEGTILGIIYLIRYVGAGNIWRFLEELRPHFVYVIPDKIRLVHQALEVLA